VDDVWHKHIPSKVSLLVWQLLRNRLPTKDNLLRRGVFLPNDADYAAGCVASETTAYLFLTCDIFNDLWSKVWHWLGISSVPSADLRYYFLQFTKMAGMPRCFHLFLSVIWFAAVWVIWKERNNRVFQNMATTPSNLIEKVKLNSFLWLRSKQVSFSYGYHDWWKNPLLCMAIHM